MFKALVLVALVQATVAALTAPQLCQIPTKYTVETGASCAGPETGYVITGYCVSPFSPNTGDVTLAPIARTTLAAANAAAFQSLTVGLANSDGCTAPSNNIAWTAVNFGGALTTVDANACGAGAAIPAASVIATPATLSTTKGVSIVCDTANNYFVSAGIEGALYCMGGTGSAGTFTNMVNRPTGLWSAQYGLVATATTSAVVLPASTSTTPNWDAGTLTCNLGCTVPSPLCAVNTYHANVLIVGTGLVTGTCLLRPGSTATLWCRSDPFNAYVATCASATTASSAGTITFSSTPNCGQTDGALTGFYILEQAPGVSAQTSGQIASFGSATSTLARVVTATLGQWGGYPRQTEPFQSASTWIVVITGCPTDTTNGQCVQQVVNWWRCRGLTIDSATVCFAARIRIACPQHTNGFRCPSSSKKGLLGLLGLLGLIPLLLCLLLLCCLLPCLLRRKKTEGDVHFATFDPHAAPVAGSFAPGTACYAPSMGAF